MSVSLTKERHFLFTPTHLGGNGFNADDTIAVPTTHTESPVKELTHPDTHTMNTVAECPTKGSSTME